MATITTIKIHPAIGVARLGNSPEFFIGPELPGDHTPPAPWDGSYKDAQSEPKYSELKYSLTADLVVLKFSGNFYFVFVFAGHSLREMNLWQVWGCRERKRKFPVKRSVR
jgi:L-Lysine epsilon oxidase N-terminal